MPQDKLVSSKQCTDKTTTILITKSDVNKGLIWYNCTKLKDFIPITRGGVPIKL